MGEELSGLGVTDLQGLENRLEMSLRSIKTRKVITYVLHYQWFCFPICFNLMMQLTSTKQDHLLRGEIEELHRKVWPCEQWPYIVPKKNSMHRRFLLTSNLTLIAQQGSLIHQENMELYRRVNVMTQQKVELCRQVWCMTFSYKLQWHITRNNWN